MGGFRWDLYGAGQVPSPEGDSLSMMPFPALTRWAIVWRACGTCSDARIIERVIFKELNEAAEQQCNRTGNQAYEGPREATDLPL
jgi:hypothetical protein